MRDVNKVSTRFFGIYLELKKYNENIIFYAAGSGNTLAMYSFLPDGGYDFNIEGYISEWNQPNSNRSIEVAIETAEELLKSYKNK